jgi:hypothetical protein
VWFLALAAGGVALGLLNDWDADHVARCGKTTDGSILKA